jgi:hypothetical protein
MRAAAQASCSNLPRASVSTSANSVRATGNALAGVAVRSRRFASLVRAPQSLVHCYLPSRLCDTSGRETGLWTVL